MLFPGTGDVVDYRHSGQMPRRIYAHQKLALVLFFAALFEKAYNGRRKSSLSGKDVMDSKGARSYPTRRGWPDPSVQGNMDLLIINNGTYLISIG